MEWCGNKIWSLQEIESDASRNQTNQFAFVDGYPISIGEHMSLILFAPPDEPVVFETLVVGFVLQPEGAINPVLGVQMGESPYYVELPPSEGVLMRPDEVTPRVLANFASVYRKDGMNGVRRLVMLIHEEVSKLPDNGSPESPDAARKKHLSIVVSNPNLPKS